MPIRDLLRRKEKVENRGVQSRAVDLEAPPRFTFVRSDTFTQETITPPSLESDAPSAHASFTDGQNESRTSRLFGGRSRSASIVSQASASSSNTKSPNAKRLSQRLHLRKSEQTSESVPADLPEINVPDGDEAREAQWEKRATLLAQKNEISRSRPTTPIDGSTVNLGSFQDLSIGGGSQGEAVVATKQTDDNIQEAIRLHEGGDLKTSTQMFGRLADPNGENNALSQVLYGLALRYVPLAHVQAIVANPTAEITVYCKKWLIRLCRQSSSDMAIFRHGWGCTPDPTEAVKYLSAAASNAATIEELALQAGMKKGGAAKGELVLAIFELANCFRYGWGVQIDKFAAKQVRSKHWSGGKPSD